MKTSERLLKATSDIWKRYNEHPFVLGIEKGNLDAEKFKYYIVQDFMYLIDYTKVFAIGVAKAKSLETMRLFADYTHVLACSELNLHKGYMAKFKISQENINKTQMAINNVAYCSYMLRIAYENSEVEILSAVLACAYSYEVIAKKILNNNPKAIEHELYGDWIRIYSSDDYSKHNRELINMFDSLSKNYSFEKIKFLEEIFVYCSEYEMKFWDFAWGSKFVGAE